MACKLCNSDARYICSRSGSLDGRLFDFYECTSCGLIFVENIRKDYENLYNQLYYQGKGADPLVDYTNEIEHSSSTIRNYEWSGICEIYHSYEKKNNTNARWLDYGCGSGGLLKYAVSLGIDIYGYEEGLARDFCIQQNLPILNEDQLESYAGYFDFISLIEVIEHVDEPVAFLAKIKKLLKPGGMVFITTGNIGPWRSNVESWPYASIPDVHIRFYDPSTLSYALRSVGLTPERLSNFSGYTSIIKFKILKNLRIKNKCFLFDMLPWGVITKLVDLKYRVSEMPIGVLK